jgi:hypothetical protein
MQNQTSQDQSVSHLLDWILRYTLFHGFDTLGSHLREEGSLDYDGGLVRLQVQMNFDMTINHQHRPSIPPPTRKVGTQKRKIALRQSPYSTPNTVHTPNFPLWPFLPRVEKGPPTRWLAFSTCAPLSGAHSSPVGPSHGGHWSSGSRRRGSTTAAGGCAARLELVACPEPSLSSHVDLRSPTAGAHAPLPELVPGRSSPLQPLRAPAQGHCRSPTGSQLAAPGRISPAPCCARQELDLPRAMPRRRWSSPRDRTRRLLHADATGRKRPTCRLALLAPSGLRSTHRASRFHHAQHREIQRGRGEGGGSSSSCSAATVSPARAERWWGEVGARERDPLGRDVRGIVE